MLFLKYQYRISLPVGKVDLINMEVSEPRESVLDPFLRVIMHCFDLIPKFDGPLTKF